MNIIGLGKAGCNIADAFAKYPQYSIFKIDDDFKSSEEHVYTIAKRGSHEEYEEKCPNFEEFFKAIDEDVLLVFSGASTVSGCALGLLEQISGHPVSILYVRPDISLLSETKAIQEKIVYNILQEYARSAVFERMYIISNVEVEKILGDVPIIGYYDTINNTIVSTFHMLNVFSYSNPIMGTFAKPVESAKISTFGVLNIEKDEEYLFFDLKFPRDRVYYYGINEDTLKTDGKLFKKITDFVKSKSEENVSISYGVFDTNYEENYGYYIAYSSMIQD